MTVRGALLEIRGLLVDPKNWIRHRSAKTISGLATVPGTRGACKFCLSGALMHVLWINGMGGEERDKVIQHMYDAVLEVDTVEAPGSVLGDVRTMVMVGFNDKRALHEDIVEVMDKAIAMAD